MAVSIITALREFNMNTDDCIQIKSEPFESSEDLFPLENRNDPDVTFNGFSYRRPPDCSECNGRPDYECSSCMCQVCFHKTNSEKRYRCFFCRKAFHEWCRNNREFSSENKWLCTKCKETEDRQTPALSVISDEVDIKDFDSEFLASNLRRLQENEAVDVKPDWKKLHASLAEGSEARIKLRSPLNGPLPEAEDNKSVIVDKVLKKFIRKMNNAPRTKICITVPSNHFGPIPGIPVGTCWKYRLQVSESGVHRPLVAGIHGRENEGAYSIVLSGVYQDDQDDGDEFLYSGCGGKVKDPSKRLCAQVKDQQLTRHNKALAVCCNAPFNDEHGAEAKNWRAGKPVRVVRNFKLRKYSMYAPEEGNRYDGIYKVVKYFPITGKSGLLIWRYLLRRDDPEPAPWTEAGQKVIQEKNLKVIYPDDIENEGMAGIKQEPQMRKRSYDYSCCQYPDSNNMRLKMFARDPANSDEYPELAEDSVVADSAPDIDVKPDINQLRASVFGFSNVANRPIDVEDCTTTVVPQNSVTKPMRSVTGNIGISNVCSIANPDSSTNKKELACNATVRTNSTSTKSSSVNAGAKNAAPENGAVVIKQEKGFDLAENIKKMIEMDTLNKAIWEYCSTYLNVNETEFLNVVKIMFTCHRCVKLADCPVTTPCDHNLCLECITNHFASKLYSCPTCHYFLGQSFKLKENKILANILEALFPAYNVKLSKFI